jgi:hypothetical protein
MNLWYNIINIRGILIMSIGDKFTIIKQSKSWKEKIMKTQSITIIAVMVLGLAGTSEAVIVELDLLSLGCPTEFNLGTSWQTDFDLGVSFTEITNVYMDWSGGITAGLAIYHDHPDEPFPLDVGLFAFLGSNPSPRVADVWGGQVTHPEAEPFDSLSEFELLGTTTWSDLLDGQGWIGIGYTEAIMLFGEYIQPGSIDLSGATLAVEGTVVPEPATLLFLGIGAISLFVKKHIR